MNSSKGNCVKSDGKLKPMSSPNDIKAVAGKGKCKRKGGKK